MKIWTRTLITFVVTLLVVGSDQTTKLLAQESLPKDQMNSYFYDLLRVGYTENIGAFLGLGNSLSEQTRFWLFVVSVGALLFYLLCYLLINPKQRVYPLVAYSLLFSGGISNFYDRITNDGAVVDFLNIGMGSIRTGIFNVADVAIVLAIFILIFSRERKARNPYKSLKMDT